MAITEEKTEKQDMDMGGGEKKEEKGNTKSKTNDVLIQGMTSGPLWLGI